MNYINRDICWSKAKVAKDLIKYALGIFNENYDRRLEYIHHQVSPYEWMVEHNSVEQRLQSEIPRFDRVKKLTIYSDGFMNCTCGRTGEYLLPCVHICRVIDKNDYFEKPLCFM